MFERFGDDARRVVVVAQEEARGLSHNAIGTEHLLLALARVEREVVVDTFRYFELTYDGLRARVEEMTSGGAVPSGHIPFTPDAKKVLERSLGEAIGLGDSGIHAEHVLLGMLDEGTGVAARVLEDAGVELAAVREKVLELRSGTSSRPETSMRAGPPVGRLEQVAVFQNWGPAGGRPVPRCALCGRDEDHCERVLVAGGVRLCSDCARDAVAQLDALPTDAPKLVRYRRPERAPSDKDAAIAAIEAAFDAVLGPMQLPVDDALAHVEGGEQLRDLLVALREGAINAPMVPSDQTVERVRFVDETTAEVSLGLWMPGNPQPMLFPVHAVCEAGTWKVARSTVEHFARLGQSFRRPGF
jgi:hypothetical protein